MNKIKCDISKKKASKMPEPSENGDVEKNDTENETDKQQVCIFLNFYS